MHVYVLERARVLMWTGYLALSHPAAQASLQNNVDSNIHTNLCWDFIHQHVAQGVYNVLHCEQTNKNILKYVLI